MSDSLSHGRHIRPTSERSLPPLGAGQSEAIPSSVKRETGGLLGRPAKGRAPRNDNVGEFLSGRALHHARLFVLCGPLDSLFDSFLPGFWALGSGYPPDIQSAVAGGKVVEILQSFLVRR